MTATVRIVLDRDGVNDLNLEIGNVLDELGIQVMTNAAPPVDTGFLETSPYVKSQRVDTFGQTLWADGFYPSPKEGKDVERQAAPNPVDPSKYLEVIIGWPALYAGYVEERFDAFMYRALMDTIQ